MRFTAPGRLAHYTLEPEGDGPDADPLRIFLRRLPGGQTLVIADVAALIWELAVDGVVDIAAAVAQIVGHPRDVVGPDVEAYLDSLLAQGLLERVPDAGHTR